MRPHIVFVLSDQHNPTVIHSHGDPHVRTPALDRLTAEGTALDNCYCASPLCVPSRAAMLSGLLGHRTGILTNHQALRSDEATFVHGLAASGYETVLAGRMHFVGPDQRHGYTERLVGDITPSTVGMAKDNYGSLRGTPGQNRRAAELSGPGRSAVLQYDEQVVQAACARLRAHSKAEQPLFLTVGLYGPHCPYVCPPDLYEYYYETLPPPRSEESFQESVHPAVRKWYQNRQVADLDLDTVRRVRAAYYGLVELTDRYVGQLVQAVADTIDLENTLLIYASDHGDMIGDKGLFWKTNMYEGSVRVPMILRQPGVIAAGRRVAGLTSLLDLAPTLIEIAGAQELPVMDGQSLVPQLTAGAPIDAQRSVVSLCADVKGDEPSAMIRRGPWKLVDHYTYETPQLFDLQDDPEERTDLGSSAAHAAIREALYAELDQVWDGQAVSEHIQCVMAHVWLRQQYNRATGTRHPDDWYADPADNFILGRANT